MYIQHQRTRTHCLTHLIAFLSPPIPSSHPPFSHKHRQAEGVRALPGPGAAFLHLRLYKARCCIFNKKLFPFDLNFRVYSPSEQELLEPKAPAPPSSTAHTLQ